MANHVMSRMDTWTSSEAFSVVAAVEHLQDLAMCMKNEEFGFNESDIDNIDHVVDALQDLETDRAKQHEILETETIQASILRHKLQFLPAQIKKECKAAVDAARQSNHEELDGLQKKLKAINDNMEYLKTRQEFLDKENASLHPERDKVRQEHEEIIQHLNRRMAEKAAKQIVLNETRDSVRETNQRIVDLEEGIVQLKEDLIQERADTRMEKKKLKKLVYDTTVKTREQKVENLTKKQEVDSLHEQVVDSEAKLEETRKSIRRYDSSRTKLEAQEKVLAAQLKKIKKQNHDLRQTGMQLQNETIKHQEEWTKRKAELEGKVTNLSEEIVIQSAKNDDLEIQKLDLEVDVKEKLRLRRLDAEKVKESNDILQSAKQLLASSAEEVGRLRQENIDMENRMEELGDTHEAIMNTLQKQIEECRDQLGKERKERVDLQQERDKGQKDIEDFKQENSKILANLTKRINDGKKMHDSLTKEGSQLQKDIRKDEELIVNLKEELATKETSFTTFQADTEREMTQLQREITEMEESIKRIKSNIELDKPGFEELGEQFRTQSKEYDLMKKNIADMKNKKQSLDDTCKRTKKEIDKMVKPQEIMRDGLKKKREESLKQMKSHAEQVKSMEQEIYALGCKLKTAMEENNRFDEANNKLESEIGGLKKEMSDTTTYKMLLEKEFTNNRESLENVWNEDEQLTEEYTARDNELVDNLGCLLSRTDEREKKIRNITEKLEKELSFLSVFLDNVSARRPKEKS